MGNAVNERSKDFLVSTADVAFLVNGQLAFTGTTSLNTSISEIGRASCRERV